MRVATRVSSFRLNFADDVFHARTHDGGLAGHRDHFVKQLRINADVTRQVVGVAVLVVFFRFRFFLVFFLRLVVAVFDDGFDAFRFAVKAFVFFWRCRRRDRGFGRFCRRRRAIRRRGRSSAFRVLCVRAVGSAFCRRCGSACSGCGAGRRCRGGRCAGGAAVGIAGGRCFGGSGLRCFVLCLLRLFLRLFLRLLLRLFAAVWCRFCVVAGFL